MDRETGTSPRIAALACILSAVALFLGASCWLGVLLLITNLHGVEWATLRLPVAAGLFQLAVALLFALCGALYWRRSGRAKMLLVAAISAFVVDLLLAIIAFIALGLLASSGALNPAG